MTQEAQKDFNAMLRQPRDMPRVQTVTDPGTIAKYGGSRMLLAPPLAYDAVMRTVPFGRLTTAGGDPGPSGPAASGGLHRPHDCGHLHLHDRLGQLPAAGA